jgi:hypothetical protein
LPQAEYPASAPLHTVSVMPEQCEQNDDWDGHAQQPQKHAATESHDRLPCSLVAQ